MKLIGSDGILRRVVYDNQLQKFWMLKISMKLESSYGKWFNTDYQQRRKSVLVMAQLMAIMNYSRHSQEIERLGEPRD